MTPFLYRQIGEALYEELFAGVAAGESAVLLAPRYGGGRHAMWRLRRTFEHQEISPLVLKLARRSDLRTATAVRRLVEQEVARTSGEAAATAAAPERMLGAVERLADALGKPVLLLAANVDSLPYPLAARFLEEVRALDQAGQAIAVLSGEESFYDLVHGPKAEFNCAHQYVLQGLTLAEFGQFAERYRLSLRLELADPGAVYEDVWRQTGGNRHLLRTLLWEILERRGRDQADGALELADVERLIQRSNLPGLYGSEIFRHATRLVAHEPRCWHHLQTLLERGTFGVPVASAPPILLELAGVAVREGTRLSFSSPWMAEFLSRHFDDRRWGDLHARVGLWEQAFEHYARLPEDDATRPVSADDRLEIELTLRNLSTAFYSRIHGGTGRLRQLFASGCRWVLGYPDVLFWRRRAGAWELEDRGRLAAETAAELLSAGDALLTEKAGGEIVTLPEPWRHRSLAAVFSGQRLTGEHAVILGDFQRRAWIAKERERLTRDLVKHFLGAWAQALALERDRDRLTRRDEHAEVMNAIFNSLGSQVLDVRHALTLAADGLRKLGYRRVLFCLVDPTGTRIQGEHESSNDPETRLMASTDYSLFDPQIDLQSWVVCTQKPQIVDDPVREPLIDPQVAARTGLGALAVVPILQRNGQALGTVHVEREDGATPSQAEVDDLLLFGRQLAIAIEQSERVSLLQSALDQIPEPVMIADGSQCVRYLNQPAARLLGRRKAGWFDRGGSTPRLRRGELGESWKLVQESLSGRQRLARQVHGFGTNPDYRGVALADDISDWKGRTLGAVLHLQDLGYLYRVFSAFQHIAQASDSSSAMRAVLEGLHGLGHAKGRLFLVDDNDPNRLVSRFILTPDGRVTEDVERIALPLRGEAHFRTWLCIEQRTPRVVCWRKDLPDGERVITAHGLEAVNANPPRCPREQDKRPGDFWIDFPLVTPQEVLGKLSLSCDPGLRPEDFHLLRMLSGMAAELLEAFLRHDRVMRGFEKQGELAMAVAAHNINTRLGVLPVVLARYRNREDVLPELAAVNADFQHTIGEVLDTIRRIKERLSAVKAERCPVDLRKMLENGCRRSLGEGQWRLDGGELTADIDRNLIESALLELLDNSRAMLVEQDLHISLALEAVRVPSGAEWVRIVYLDNGPGVPDHLKTRIFEHFYSRRPGQRNSNGLGLNFVARVLEAHGGVVSETGTAGQGARFVLSFPRFAGPPADKEAANVQVVQVHDRRG